MKSLTDADPRPASAKAIESLADGMVKSNAAVVFGFGLRKQSAGDLAFGVIAFQDEGRHYGIEVRRRSYDKESSDYESWEAVVVRLPFSNGAGVKRDA